MKRIKLGKLEKVKRVYLNGLFQELGKQGDYIIDNKGIEFNLPFSQTDTIVIETI